MKKAIIITGPTASGKTSLAIKLAKQLHPKESLIINSDSLLFYKGLDIGTAKPTMAEREGIPHKLIDIADIDSPLNAKIYSDLATEILNDLEGSDVTPFIVGGSPFYLRALLLGLYGEEHGSNQEQLKEIRFHIESLYSEYGIAPIREKLKEVDPESFENLHPNDHYRNMRALEYYSLFNEKISDQKKGDLEFDFTEHKFKNYQFLHIHLDIPKEDHLKIIDQRTHDMLDKGLIQEVEDILRKGYTGHEKPLQSIGYKEVQLYLNGEIENYSELMERISISTRQLAKSQRTFFKKIHPKLVFNPQTDMDKIEEAFHHFIK
jgi:tRNA dimethylallyltransferase